MIQLTDILQLHVCPCTKEPHHAQFRSNTGRLLSDSEINEARRLAATRGLILNNDGGGTVFTELGLAMIKLTQ